MGPPPFVSKFALVSELPQIRAVKPREMVCILSSVRCNVHFERDMGWSTKKYSIKLKVKKYAQKEKEDDQ